MATPEGAPRDFEKKIGSDLRNLIQRNLELWEPYVKKEDAINIALSSLAFCGVTICMAADAPPKTFASYAKRAEEILTHKRTL